MENTITGLIVSTQLAKMGEKIYGFISIETDKKEHFKVKVSAFTKHETLDVGARVSVVGEPLGTQGVWTAKMITKTIR